MPLRKWTPEQIANMHALARMGRSYAEIAAVFGTTRSVICGVMWRNRPRREIPQVRTDYANEIKERN